MNEIGYLTVYSILVLMFSICGGYLPFLGQVSHSRLQLYLSISAGVMLGASFFHVMPEAMAMSKGNFGWWMSLGVVGLFCIERFIAPHSHEVNGGGHAQGEHDHHDHEHGHSEAEHADDHHAAAPAVAGWMAVLGLTIHTFMNGVGLAGAVFAVADAHEASTSSSLPAFLSALPGLAMFLAIFLHKPADAMAITTVLSRKGVGRNVLALVQFGFACMVPVGVLAFYLTRGAIEKEMQNELTGAALAFSAGTFLFIALSDLLPEVQFHRHDRLKLFFSLVLGVAFMGAIAYLEGHDHGGHSHGAATGHSHSKQDADNDHSHGHKHKHKHDHGHKHDHDHD